jgi:hypothetical protein
MALPQLYVDAEPRTQTAAYRFPPSRPELPAAACSPEQLLDIASGAYQQRDQLWALVGSSDHVAAICRDYAERVEPALRDAETRIADLEQELGQARAFYLAERQRLHGELDGLQRELARLRLELQQPRIHASMERLTITVTGRSYAEVSQQLTSALRVDGLFDKSDTDTVVIDLPDGGDR